jgi:hypothetical protein
MALYITKIAESPLKHDVAGSSSIASSSRVFAAHQTGPRDVSVDGMLIEAWASLKSFRPKEDDDDDSHRRDSDGTRGSDKNPWMNFKGEKCKNDTRESPEALAVAAQ